VNKGIRGKRREKNMTVKRRKREMRHIGGGEDAFLLCHWLER
jgi:hypothetical protein